MNRHAKAFIILLILGIITILTIYFTLPILLQEKQKRTSDARAIRETITIGVDNWIGYYPLCSHEMRKRMRSSGYNLKCVDDQANYKSRMDQLSRGAIDFAVATVDSWLQNGAEKDYPGTIVMVIDESKGGDAIVANKKIANIEGLKKNRGYKIALTPDSPSEHLLRSVAVHFGISALKKLSEDQIIETDGSPKALEKILNGEADVAVLWEPDVSKAVSKPGIVKLLGTEDTNRLIVDILVVNRDFSERKPELVTQLMANYFRTLKTYRDYPERLRKEIVDETGLTETTVATMLRGVHWATMTTNSRHWFGVEGEGQLKREDLVSTIEETLKILIDSEQFDSSPVPDENNYYLINSEFITNLVQQGISEQYSGFKKKDSLSEENPLQKRFSSISDEAWDKLLPIGTLKIHPIHFQSGTAILTDEGEKQIEQITKTLEHYPNFRIIVKGHTSIRGIKEENQRLSENRANSVKQFLIKTYGIDSNRVRSIGKGGSEPLPRKPGESNRGYYYRLPRVEIYLVSENF